LEAQSWGLACVVSDIPGNCAVVKDGVNGLIVPVGDAASLANAILRLLGDAGLRRQLGNNAREKAQKEFSLEAITDRLLEAYRSLGVSIVP
jgi:glycosyltransferase involved in cell wall biosynthesis